jgi:hypothetical protein
MVPGWTAASRAVRLVALSVVVLAACAACGQAAGPPSLARCSGFGVQAIRRHMVVRAVPAACAGLSRAQVNEAVASAVREAVGPLPKAAARRLQARDGSFLAPLIASIPPSAPAAVTSGGSGSSGGTPLRLLAMVSWLLTAAAGGYLLARTGALHRRPARRPGARSLSALSIGHVTAAVACLGALTALAVTGVTAAGWVAAGLVIVVAGLGLATLVSALPEPAAGAEGRVPAAGGRQQRLALVIALHGLLATVTILLIWLAAVGGS